MSTLFQTNETLQANRQQKMLDILKVSTLNKNGETADNKKSIYSVLPADSKLVRSEVNDTNFSINTDLQTSIRSSLNANSEVDATTTFLNEAYAAQKAGKVVDQNYLSALEKNILTATGGEQYYSKETGKLENTPDISGMDFAQKNALSNEQKSAIANYEYIREGSFNQRIKAEALNHSVEEYMTAEQLEMYNGALSQVGTGTIDQDGLDRIKTDFYVDSLKENGQFDAFKESFNTSFNETGKESLKTQMHIALNDSYSESGWLANTSNEAVGIPTMDTFVVLDSQMNTAGIGIDSTQWMGYGTIGSAALGYDYSIVKKYGELLSNGQSLIEVSTTDQRTAMFGTSFPDVLINEAWQGALRNDTSNWNTIARILDGWVDNLTLAPESGEVPTIHINSDVNSKFTQANVQAFGDPLVMDLDGDGIETVASDGSVLFDHNADGVKTGTGWAASDDGLLVRDLDGSGTIDNGQELFGDNTIKADGTKAIDGFDALSDLDSNADGIFNSQDTAFEEVKVWQDKNQDGISQADELMSLSEAGIADINLNTNTVNQNVAGGVLRKEATVTNVDGTTTKVGAMDFAENKFHSEFTDNLEIPEELQGSVNVAGQGALRSLNEAASQSPELKELLTNLYSGEVAITDAAINEVLLEWAKTSSNNNNFTTSLELLDGITLDDGTQINVGVSDRVRTIIEKTAVLEAINGERLLDYQINDHGSYYNIYVETGSEISNFSSGNATVSKGGTVALNDWDYHRLVDNGRTTLINDAYASAFNSIKEAINTSLIAKEIQPMLLENISFELDANGEVALNFDGINEMLVNNIKADPAGGINFLSKVIEAKDVTLLNNGWDSQAFLEGNVANVLSEIIGSEVSFAVTNNGNFTINGKSFDLNSLAGTSGADFILGTSDNDIINAGTGDDEIYGKLGDDVINTGDGNDTVYAGEGNDRVTVGINNGYNSIYGESGDDVLNATGSWSRNTLDGGEGNDTIRGGYQNDVLRGGSGDDVISTGERSSDYVEGGLGNDTLISDYGSKDVVYKYNLGDGFDTIKRGSTKFYSSWGNIHQDYFKQKVVFGEGISSSDVSFSKEGNDLLLQIGADATQGMRVEGFYSGDGKYKSKVSRFEFADGTVLSESNIGTVVTGSTNEADVLSGGSSHDYIESLSGDDVINTGDGNDTVYAGEGNDRVTVGINNGYNSIYGESGDDV
ncbi:calcium-binding protein, partial [Francisella philomiragia]|uniref:calcium-binding protein n=1 Tax=Francisella philomiragia TaxID=28110 RepID=UPI0021CACDCD